MSDSKELSKQDLAISYVYHKLAESTHKQREETDPLYRSVNEADISYYNDILQRIPSSKSLINQFSDFETDRREKDKRIEENIKNEDKKELSKQDLAISYICHVGAELIHKQKNGGKDYVEDFCVDKQISYNRRNYFMICEGDPLLISDYSKMEIERRAEEKNKEKEAI